MDSSTTAVDRRRAHRRVGAATVLAFLALLLIGASRGPAAADPTVPSATPTISPSDPVPRDHDGLGPRHRDGDGDGVPGFGGGGHDGDGGGGARPAPGGGGTAPAPGGGGTARAPSSGGSQT
jgi:hypothetical protein